MNQIEEILKKDIPEPLIASASKDVVEYSIGLVRIECYWVGPH